MSTISRLETVAIVEHGLTCEPEYARVNRLDDNLRGIVGDKSITPATIGAG
jgi:hypothetical protein